MSWIVYENEPFEASPRDEGYLRRVLRGDLETTGRLLRIVRRAGHLLLPDGRTLIVRSRKATGAGLLSWLAYGDPSLHSLRVLGALPSSASAADFGSLAARLFCMETWRAIQSSGLIRTYQRQHVRSAVIRGRIDFAAMAHAGGDLSRTPCVVFARLPRTPLNCLLAAAVSAILRDPELRVAAASALPPLAALLSDVPPLVDPDLLAGKRALSRIEQGFEASAALGRLVVRSAGLAGGGELTGPSFLLNLANLFESSVVRAFRDSHLDAVPKHPLPIYRHTDRGDEIDRQASMQLDLYLPDVRGEPVVVDAKYRSRISAANLQQMATYCWLAGARRGVLVVPSGLITDRRSFLLRAGYSFISEIRIDIIELDLSGATLAEWGEASRRLVGAVEC